MSYSDRQRLEHVISSTDREATLPSVSDEVRARMAQLMTVFASGYLEASCRDVLGSYASSRAETRVVRFVNRSLTQFQNPKLGKIVALVAKFDPDRAKQLEEFAEGSVKDGVNSIVALRHQIAHGQPVDVSVGRIRAYYTEARKLVAKLEELFPRSKDVPP